MWFERSDGSMVNLETWDRVQKEVANPVSKGWSICVVRCASPFFVKEVLLTSGNEKHIDSVLARLKRALLAVDSISVGGN